jgi:KipI family sensor histidine kinase inhibitor
VTGPLDRRIVPFGDEALLVTLDTVASVEANLRAHALARLVLASGEPWGRPVPGYASVLVPFDAARVPPDQAAARLASLVEEAGAVDLRADPTGAVTTIEVRYGGEGGPDLAHVAERTGLTPEHVIELHASVTYLVHMLGFAPGFGYLGELPAELALPRRADPRTRVPAGSVANAGRQSAVYPFSTPGGWHLIGRTDERMWRPEADPPALLAPSLRVRFVPVAG